MAVSGKKLARVEWNRSNNNDAGGGIQNEASEVKSFVFGDLLVLMYSHSHYQLYRIEAAKAFGGLIMVK